MLLSIFVKCQDRCERPAVAGDLSDEVDEVQVCDSQVLGEEKGYEADGESNPEDSAQLEEGTIHTYKCSVTVLFHVVSHHSKKYIYCWSIKPPN